MKKKRKLGRGKPLEELTKGSHDYLISQVRAAFRAQFPRDYESEPYRYVEEVFDGYVIVQSGELAPDEYYYVTYETGDEGYVFADRDEWEVVELSYKPISEAKYKIDNGKRFVERIDGQVTLLEAAKDGGPRRIKAVGITSDVVNGNGRRYPAAVLRAAVNEARTHLHESLGQGRCIPLLGEAEHPSDKSGRPNLLETVVKWEDIDFDGTNVLLEGILLGTSKGQDVAALMEGGVMPGVSQRAYGDSKFIREGGRRIEEVTELKITGYDLVLEPSDPTAGVTMFESKKEEENEMKLTLQELMEKYPELAEALASLGDDRPLTVEVLREEHPQLVRQILKEHQEELDEAVQAEIERRQREEEKLNQVFAERERTLREKLGIGETGDPIVEIETRNRRLTELEEAERKRQVAVYVEKEVESLKYPELLKEQMAEALGAMELTSLEEAKTAIIAKRKEYDAFAARLELAAKGYGENGLRMLGPVLEQETGTPEFARGAHMLTESMVKAGKAPARKWNRPPEEMSINERFTAMLLEKFDEKFQRYLIEESRAIEEAEQTSDLNLPYSVARAVIAEATPRLVAVSIFDVGVTDQAPTRIYYEVYSGETGASASVTDESVTIAALDTFYELDYKRVQPGTVTVTDSGGGTTYVEGTDYVIDYANGEIKALTGGGISASDSVLVDYTYDAVRKGEMGAIERAKLTLTYKTLEIAADRLATEISTEAVVFARSQIGWDATGRTLVGLVRKIQELIDKGLLYMGLMAALSVANNSGGEWSATPSGVDTYQDNLDILFRYIGVAKVKVANRYYEPTFILASTTNGDLLSNSEQFTAAGARPDSDLNAAGYVGRVKGLPVFESTQFSDSYILVGNRELVMHRVFQAMVLKGPYPSYSGNKLVSSEQYYAEEFNGTDAPVPEKSSYVKLTS